MKRPITFLLLLMFLFNVVGYYGVYLGLHYQSNRAMKARLDADIYAKDQLLTVSIPYLIPYQAETGSFERLDGEFEKDGEFFQLVSHKIERDTLFVTYIKDHHETSLYKFLTTFIQSNTDAPASKTALKIIESFTKDYLCSVSTLQPLCSGWSRNIVQRTLADLHVIVRDMPVFSPPPNFS